MTQTLERDVATPSAPAHATSSAQRRRDNVILAALVAVLSASFYYGWFQDPTHPVGGRGWSDQNLYTDTALRIADGHLPTFAQMHFAPTYSIFGAAGSFISRGDPFWSVSYLLLIGSAIFLYRGSRVFFNQWFSVLFMISVFAWDGHARTFNYVSELFTIPWNNQLLFFAFAFFFWLYATRRTGPIDLRLMIAMGVIGGLLATTREESVLFLVPLALFYLVYRRASLVNWIGCGAAAAIAAFPGLLIKYQVLGSIFVSGPSRPGDSYSGTISGYLSVYRFRHNLTETIVNSNMASVDTKRQALLQATPWLWIAPLGIVLILMLRKFDLMLKWFVVMSGVLMVFYLSGNNVQAGTLKYHCLRYMTPAFIALHFAVIVVLASIFDAAKRSRRLRSP